MKNTLPGILVALLVSALAFGAGPQLTVGSRVRNDGDTMTGTLTINVTDAQTALSIEEGDRLILNGGTNTYYFESSAGTLALVLGGGSQMTFDQVMTFTRASGFNAIGLNTNGARIDLGSGSLDYFDSDGTNIQTGGDIDIGGNGITGVETTTTFAIQSNTADATTSSTVAAITLGTTVDIAAADLVVRFADSSGNTLFAANETGDLSQRGSGFFSGSVVTRAWCGWRFQEGQTATITNGCAAFTEVDGAARAANTGDTSRYFVNLTTSTADNNTSNVLTAVESLFSRSPRFSSAVRTGSSITNIRIWVGLTEGALSDTDTPSTIDSAAFRFSTGASDTAWMCCTSDGTTASCSSSSTTADPSTSYKMAIRPSGASWLFYLNDALVCTKDTNAPGATQNVRGHFSVDVISGGVAKTLGIAAGAVEIP